MRLVFGVAVLLAHTSLAFSNLGGQATIIEPASHDLECPNSCSKHGSCIKENGAFGCVCDPGWSGADCSSWKPTEVVSQCINDCNKHGSCIPDGPGKYACECDAGWFGADCSQRIIVENTSASGGEPKFDVAVPPPTSDSTASTVTATEQSPSTPGSTTLEPGVIAPAEAPVTSTSTSTSTNNLDTNANTNTNTNTNTNAQGEAAASVSSAGSTSTNDAVVSSETKVVTKSESNPVVAQQPAVKLGALSPSSSPAPPTPTPFLYPLPDCSENATAIINQCLSSSTINCDLTVCHVDTGCDCVTDAQGDVVCGRLGTGVCLPQSGLLQVACTFRSNVVQWRTLSGSGSVTVTTDGECPPEITAATAHAVEHANSGAAHVSVGVMLAVVTVMMSAFASL